MSLSSPVVHDVDSWDRAVSRFADLQKRRAALEAEELRLLADAVDMIRDAEAAYRGRAHGDRSIPLRSLVADLAVATVLSEWTVKRALGDAADLCDRFAAGVTALEQGRLTRRHLAVIHDAGAAIDDAELRDRYLQLALERAAETTAGRLGPIVETIAARVNPVSIDERHESAAERRGVWVREKGDAMGELVLAAPIVLVRAGYDRLTRFADEIVGTRDADAEAAAADRAVHRRRRGGRDPRSRPGDGARAHGRRRRQRAVSARRLGSDRRADRATPARHGRRLGAGGDLAGDRSGALCRSLSALGRAGSLPASS